jgi:hypothetical protein
MRKAEPGLSKDASLLQSSPYFIALVYNLFTFREPFLSIEVLLSSLNAKEMRNYVKVMSKTRDLVMLAKVNV